MTTDTVVEVKALKKHFGTSIKALDGVDLSIERGEVAAIIGPSGSGKSTLLRCINLLERPSSGQVFFEGCELTSPKTDINYYRERIGMVFQHFNLFPHKTVLDNITLAPRKLKKQSREQAEERAMELLRRVGLADRAKAWPSQLSGGQKQRIAIAGILAIQPQCIVLDEPTAMLDPSGREEVMSTLIRLNKEMGITVVLITHYMDEAVSADRVVVMDSGKVLTQGTPGEVFSQVELLKKHRLDVPQAAELAFRLKGCGVKIDRIPLDEEECAQMLLEVMK